MPGSRLWTRILVVHPVALVVPAVVLSYLLALRGERHADDVWPVLFLILLSPLASAGLTIRFLRPLGLSRRTRDGLVALSLAAGLAAAFVGVLLWWDAIEIACENRYECPL